MRLEKHDEYSRKDCSALCLFKVMNKCPALCALRSAFCLCKVMNKCHSEVCFRCHSICILVCKLYTVDLTLCQYYPQLLVACAFNSVHFTSRLCIALCPVVPYLIVGILTCMFFIIVAKLEFWKIQFNSDFTWGA